METETLGRVTTSAIVENFTDIIAVELGVRPADQVRQLELTDASVDTGAITLSLPTRLIQQLGLTAVSTKLTRTAGGPRQATL